MSISFDAALGNHEAALHIRARRAEVLASNLANADTPNYKARDIDFKTALQRAEAGKDSPLRTTHENHLAGTQSGPFGTRLIERAPTQPSLDGNTVDVQREQAAFGETMLRYQANLQFLGGRFKGMLGAIKGE